MRNFNQWSLAVLSLLLLTAGALADTEKSNQLVEEAWDVWDKNDHAAVEAKFQEAIAQDPKNKRAYLGLAALYTIQEKHEKAWATYRHITKITDDNQPYLYAAWSSGKVIFNEDDSSSGIVDIYHELADSGNKNGLMRALANQSLGEYYEKRNKLPLSRQHYRDVNTVNDWKLIGPFDNVSASGFNKAFPPESEFKPDAKYQGKNAVPAQWFNIAAIRPDNWIDFRRYFAHMESIFYGNTFVYSPKKQTVNLTVGTSGSLKAFLNDQVVIEYFDENNNDLDTYVVETELQKGWNRLLVKVGFSEIERCNFLVRVTDTQGGKLKDIRISSDAQKYRKMKNTPVKTIPNFAEAYFEAQVKAHPDHVENYLLLADCYLRNDKAIEGELVLRDAISRRPENALFYIKILEAYNRGEKYDEVLTTIEKIYSLDKNIPQVLIYKYDQFLENEQFEQAEEVLAKLETLIPNTQSIYQQRLAMYSAKREIEKYIATAKEAYESFPESWQMARQQATISYQTTRSYYESVNIYQDYLSRNYNATTLATLANIYLEAQDVEQWEATYLKLFELDPSFTGYYYQMANTYQSLQQYDKAHEVLEKTLQICPNSSTYWAKMGELHRLTNAPEKAKEAYREALRFSATNYDAREKLRELEGKSSIFNNFEMVNVEELVANAPGSDAYPTDDALVLLNDMKRVVYENGASETFAEMLIKVFNNQGIDSYKEYQLPYNGHTEQLTIEKAVVMKKDGSEISGDINRNHIVFKSLEQDEVIYIKWKIKNFYSGKLSNHFWDRFHFSDFDPSRDIRYSLLVPKDFDFSYNAQNIDVKPVKKKTPDGMLYQWRLVDQPAISYEYDMPLLEDVGKVLYISSIKDWEFMVDWYSDIALTKARSSYEIREQVEKLFAGRENVSRDEKIKIIYNFITENIRYSSVSFRQSAMVPQKARDVLVNKIGDCKDVSALAIAMLKEVGIDAHYVLVNTRDEGYNTNVLPSIPFNHCIAGVETSQGIKYLDLTANNYGYGSVPAMDMEAFTLLIKPGNSDPEYLDPKQFTARNLNRRMLIEVDEQNGIQVEKTGYRTGTLAAGLRNGFRDEAPSNRRKMLTETLSENFPNVKLLSFKVENLEEVNAGVQFDYAFEAPDYVSQTGEFKFFRIPWTDYLTYDRALSYEQRQYPYLFWPSADSLIEEVEIKMPPGYEPLELGDDIAITSSAADYNLTFRIENGQVIGRRQLVYKKSVVSPEEYVAFRSFYNRVVKEDARQILLRRVQQNQ